MGSVQCGAVNLGMRDEKRILFLEGLSFRFCLEGLVDRVKPVLLSWEVRGRDLRAFGLGERRCIIMYGCS